MISIEEKSRYGCTFLESPGWCKRTSTKGLKMASEDLLPIRLSSNGNATVTNAPSFMTRREKSK